MKITVVYPQSDSARAALARRVAAVHAEHIIQRIQRLCCSLDQKQLLMDATIHKITTIENQLQ